MGLNTTRWTSKGLNFKWQALTFRVCMTPEPDDRFKQGKANWRRSMRDPASSNDTDNKTDFHNNNKQKKHDFWKDLPNN